MVLDSAKWKDSNKLPSDLRRLRNVKLSFLFVWWLLYTYNYPEPYTCWFVTAYEFKCWVSRQDLTAGCLPDILPDSSYLSTTTQNDSYKGLELYYRWGSYFIRFFVRGFQSALSLSLGISGWWATFVFALLTASTDILELGSLYYSICLRKRIQISCFPTQFWLYLMPYCEATMLPDSGYLAIF